MNKGINKSIISLMLGGVLAVSGCGNNKAVAEEPVLEVTATTEPEYVEMDMNEEIKNKSWASSPILYDNLKVTGKQLASLDIYEDSTKGKYAVICGQSLFYLPIDKNGVVKIQDGMYKYWMESRYLPVYILVGKEAEKFTETQSNVTGAAMKVFMNDYLCEYMEIDFGDGSGNKSISIDLEDFCDKIDVNFIRRNDGLSLSALNNQFRIEIDNELNVSYEDTDLRCSDIDLVDGKYLVGIDFLRKALGIVTYVDGNECKFYGEIIPQIVLLETYTATGAEKKPLGENKGINMLKVFGESDQKSLIESGVISNQVFFKFEN